MTLHIKTAYALSVSFEHRPDTPSKYRPRRLQKGVPFHDEQRWKGYAAALTRGWVSSMHIVGGYEPLGPQDTIPAARDESTTQEASTGFLVNRGWAAVHYLRTEHSINPERVGTLVSSSNTQGNYFAIQQHLLLHPCNNAYVLTGFLHLPRSLAIAHALGMSHLPHLPSEAFLYLDDRQNGLSQDEAIARLQKGFGGDDTAKRMSAEIAGIGDLLAGAYAPRET